MSDRVSDLRNIMSPKKQKVKGTWLDAAWKEEKPVVVSIPKTPSLPVQKPTPEQKLQKTLLRNDGRLPFKHTCTDGEASIVFPGTPGVCCSDTWQLRSDLVPTTSYMKAYGIFHVVDIASDSVTLEFKVRYKVPKDYEPLIAEVHNHSSHDAPNDVYQQLHRTSDTRVTAEVTVEAEKPSISVVYPGKKVVFAPGTKEGDETNSDLLRRRGVAQLKKLIGVGTPPPEKPIVSKQLEPRLNRVSKFTGGPEPKPTEPTQQLRFGPVRRFISEKAQGMAEMADRVNETVGLKPTRKFTKLELETV